MRKLKTTLCTTGFDIGIYADCSSPTNAQLTICGLIATGFDSTVMGKKAEPMALTNKNGMQVCVTKYGASVVTLCVPDKHGKPQDVVIHRLAYQTNEPHLRLGMPKSISQARTEIL